MEFNLYTSDLIKIDLLWKIFVAIAMLILWHILENYRIKREYSSSKPVILDEENSDQITARDIRTVTEHFIASIKEGRKWYADGKSLGRELEFHWDHRQKVIKDVRKLTSHQREVLVNRPVVFFSEFKCSDQMDLIMQATAKYS